MFLHHQVKGYQQALQRFDRGIDSLSRRLAANIDQNISFEKIESIQVIKSVTYTHTQQNKKPHVFVYYFC